MRTVAALKTSGLIPEKITKETLHEPFVELCFIGPLSVPLSLNTVGFGKYAWVEMLVDPEVTSPTSIPVCGEICSKSFIFNENRVVSRFKVDLSEANLVELSAATALNTHQPISDLIVRSQIIVPPLPCVVATSGAAEGST